MASRKLCLSLLQTTSYLPSKKTCLLQNYLRIRPVLTKASLSTSTNKPQVAQPQIVAPSVAKSTGVSSMSLKQNWLELKFNDGEVGSAPFLWLRENCQCSKCYDHVALGRRFLFTDLTLNTKPADVSCDDGNLNITWNDGHNSSYSKEWLYYRAFTIPGKKAYEAIFQLKKMPWGRDLNMERFDYNELKLNETSLLKWMLTLERNGVALVENTPPDEDSGAALIDHIAFVKPSHYGRHSPVINRPNSNNVAFTNAKLGMHTDLAQYDYQAGIIFIHALKQHEGAGGESVISDGLFSAEVLRLRNPQFFKKLSETDVYFWDKGVANFESEMDNFFKISKGPIIKLNNRRQVEKVSVNNAVRDSFIDLPPEEVDSYYRSMKLYHDLLYENSYHIKMKSGDMLTMDNLRCVHGREGYEANSPRHIESSYLDWDEARCRRRRLQEKYPEI